MFCTRCGLQLEDRDRFCAECGTPTGKASTLSQKTTDAHEYRKKVCRSLQRDC